jgi:hypothetical protein
MVSPGIEATRPQKPLLRPAYLRLLRTLRASESASAGAIAWYAAASCQQLFRRVPPPLRKICDYAQPVDPLKSLAHPPPIDLVLPCAARDVPNLRIVIQGALATIRNPIRQIRIITPSDTFAEPAAAAELLRLASAETRCVIERDEDVLSREVAEAIAAIDRPAGTSWVTQQAIKLSAVLRSSIAASLVLDADTVPMVERTWYGGAGRQIVQCSHEYHVPYVEHERRVFGPDVGSSGISFVTHHQLMQRDVLKEMFGDDARGLVDWIGSADYAHPSALSEYETYGSYMLARHRRWVHLARWDNHVLRDGGAALTTASDFADFRALIRRAAPHAGSVSCHHWL